ncbi:MAG: tRNA dihydrouridine(20/20a) synthase DusA [Gammaproteobacteria bacterium]
MNNGSMEFRGKSVERLDRRICVAPMMDYTDRHCRYFLRLLNPSALLYTEMVTAPAIVRGDRQRLLTFDPQEHPVALQLGGSDPRELAAAARIGEEFGYDEINLNCGCPSDRVQSGRFGACLMAEPELVADCIAAIRESVRIPVTVKCRIGIEPMPQALDEYEFLKRFVATVAAAGCNVFVVHARRAILQGLSPKENREIPPLRYDIARRLREDFPELEIVLNGGLRTIEQVAAELPHFDGVMIGREAYHNPYFLAQLYQRFVDPHWRLPSREEVLEQFVPYVRARLEEGHSLRAIIRHVQGLYAGQPNARAWRRFLSEQGARNARNADVLLESLRIVRAA